jgi:aspartyl-tRNA(Asn)/glutamyl-tRNA(Gln) amidotransferase subunit A
MAMVMRSHFLDYTSLPEAERPIELARCRARTATLGRKLNAVVNLCEAGPGRDGPLADLPYAAKDIFANGLTAPTWGCAEPPVAVARPALVLTRLDDAGACRLAAAEMTELAYEPSGYNSVRGRALNPWNSNVASGGSSSGAAVLVAAGCCAVALGSDSGGSVRIPAHCCGVTALKPSWGAIPVEGAMPLAPSLDTVGIIARSATDIGKVWPVVAERAGNAVDTRSAVVLADAFEASEAEIARVCRQAVDAIADLGIVLSERPGFSNEADRQALLVLQAEAARIHRSRFEDERIDATLRKRLSKGLAIGDDELAASLNARTALLNRFLSERLGDADVALLPVMPIKTPLVGEVDPRLPTFKPKTLYAMSRFTRFANYFGLPVLAVPAGFDDRGLPVGLQIVGRPDSEASLIAIGAALQARHDWHGRIPTQIAPDIAAEKGLAA